MSGWLQQVNSYLRLEGLEGLRLIKVSPSLDSLVLVMELSQSHLALFSGQPLMASSLLCTLPAVDSD